MWRELLTIILLLYLSLSLIATIDDAVQVLFHGKPSPYRDWWRKRLEAGEG